MGKNKDLDIVVILDRSGSMEKIRDATIGMFNEFKNEQVREKGKTRMTLVTFDKSHNKRRLVAPTKKKQRPDPFEPTTTTTMWPPLPVEANISDDVRVVHSQKDVRKVPNLSRNSFRPRGGTNLLDAVGHTVNKFSGEGRLTECGECGCAVTKKTRTLVVVITDGMENSSIEYTADDVRRLINSKEECGWKFLYLGANQDAWSEGMGMGFRGGDTFSYVASDTGVMNVGETVTAFASGYRAGDDTSSLRDTAKGLGIEDSTGRK